MPIVIKGGAEVGIFDSVKKIFKKDKPKTDESKTTQPEEKKEDEQEFGSAEFGEAILEVLLNDFDDGGELDPEMLATAKDNLPGSKLYGAFDKIRGKSEDSEESKDEKGKKGKAKKTTISSDLAKGKDMGKVGKEYGKFIESIVKYEEYVRSEKIPNVELGAESTEIATAYLELSKVYESIIEAASIYEEHRKSIKVGFLRNLPGGIKNRMAYVASIKGMVAKEQMKVGEFLGQYEKDPKKVVAKLSSEDDEKSGPLTWFDAISAARSGLLTEKKKFPDPPTRPLPKPPKKKKPVKPTRPLPPTPKKKRTPPRRPLPPTPKKKQVKPTRPLPPTPKKKPVKPTRPLPPTPKKKPVKPTRPLPPTPKKKPVKPTRPLPPTPKKKPVKPTRPLPPTPKRKRLSPPNRPLPPTPKKRRPTPPNKPLPPTPEKKLQPPNKPLPEIPKQRPEPPNKPLPEIPKQRPEPPNRPLPELPKQRRPEKPNKPLPELPNKEEIDQEIAQEIMNEQPEIGKVESNETDTLLKELDSLIKELDDLIKDIDKNENDDSNQEIEPPTNDVKNLENDIKSFVNGLENPTNEVENPSNEIDGFMSEIDQLIKEINDLANEVEHEPQEVLNPEEEIDGFTTENEPKEVLNPEEEIDGFETENEPKEVQNPEEEIDGFTTDHVSQKIEDNGIEEEDKKSFDQNTISGRMVEFLGLNPSAIGKKAQKKNGNGDVSQLKEASQMMLLETLVNDEPMEEALLEKQRKAYVPNLDGYIDGETASKILALDGKMMRFIMLDIVSEFELTVLETRLFILKKILRSKSDDFVQDWSVELALKMSESTDDEG